VTGILVTALVLGLPALAFALWPLLGNRDRSQALLRFPVDRRGELEERKGATLRALRELRFEHEAGHIGDDDYAGLRARYESEAAVVLTELDRLGAAVPVPEPPPARGVDSRSAWRHPAALTVGGVLLLAFGIAIGAGLVRYAEPDRPAGVPMPGALPLVPSPTGAAAGTSGAPGATGAVAPEVLQGMLSAARSSLFGGRYGEAIAAYQAVLKREPKNVDALTHLGLIVAIGGHADAALETFERALAVDPNYPPALLYRGQVLYTSKKDTAGAVRSWEKFVAVVPPGEDRARVETMIAEARARRQEGGGLATPSP
jgi:tetratricopeptide (TPR) repeat protein